MPISNTRLLTRVSSLLAAFVASASLGCVLYVEDTYCGPHAFDYRGGCFCDDDYDGDDPAGEGCYPVMTVRVTDDCDDGHDVRWKLYSDSRDWSWPTGTDYYTTPGYFQDGLEAILCEDDEWVCYGAETDGGLEYGVGLDFSTTCDDCCFPCRAGELDLGYLTCN